MFNPAKMDIWTGRIDEGREKQSRLWHQCISPLKKNTAEPGIALLGICCDEGVKRNKGRTGSAEGPDIIRKALSCLPFHLDRPLYDAGNLYCDNNHLEQLQQEQAVIASKLLAQGHFPLLLGGGHEIAFGSFVGLDLFHTRAGNRKQIGIINFDSHFDLRKAELPNSGTPFLQISDYCRETELPFRYLCLGPSETGNTGTLFERAKELGAEYLKDEEITSWNLGTAEGKLEAFIRGSSAVYLSIDLDVLPAATAPGVSAPAARGLSLEILEHLLNLVKSEAGNKLRIADIAEFNPRFDIDGRTARVAARLCHLLAR